MWYTWRMDSTPGAMVAPHAGQAIAGVPLASSVHPDSHTKHRFVHLLHDMVDHSTAFPNEEARHEAHRTLEAFRAAILPAEHVMAVIKETDRAPVEDVRLRRAPNAGYAVAPAAPVIDYALLAQYIVQAQQAQQRTAEQVQAQATPEVTQASADGVHVITDAPASE